MGKITQSVTKQLRNRGYTVVGWATSRNLDAGSLRSMLKGRHKHLWFRSEKTVAIIKKLLEEGIELDGWNFQSLEFSKNIPPPSTADMQDS